MEMIYKVKQLRDKYKGWKVELTDRLDELSSKDLWDLYAEREIHLRYVNSMIEDIDSLLNSGSELGVLDSQPPSHGVYSAVTKRKADRDNGSEESENTSAGTLPKRSDSESDLYQCERWLNHGADCKEWCGKCEMGGKLT